MLLVAMIWKMDHIYRLPYQSDPNVLFKAIHTLTFHESDFDKFNGEKLHGLVNRNPGYKKTLMVLAIFSLYMAKNNILQ